MASVVFLRGVNVGGHKKFQPSVLAEELADFDVVNVGAAGTFVVRKAIGQRSLRAEFIQRLPFESELMICPGRDLINLASGKLFADEIAPKGTRQFLSMLAKRPRTPPPLPLCQPAGDKWQVKIIGICGRFAVSLWRKMGRTLIYPNEVVEKNLGVAATTRNWNTLSAICAILEERERLT